MADPDRWQFEVSLQTHLSAAVDALALAHQQADPAAASHCERVAGLASGIGELLGLGEDQVEFVRLAGLVHDLGKQKLARGIMDKDGPLSPHEVALVRTHSALGRDIVARLSPRLAEVVHQHHERLDGSGYPRGLKGGVILPEARILAVADVAEAMLSPRPWRPAHGMDAVLAVLRGGAGTAFDAEAVDACCAFIDPTADARPALADRVG